MYEEYVQIKTRKPIDSKSIKVQTPKELVFEGGRELRFDMGKAERYYVYSAGEIEALYCMPAKAVNLAYDISGIVVNEQGTTIWHRGNRVTKNQIMAIKATRVNEERNSLAVCLDTVLNFEGIVRNNAELLKHGDSVSEILSANLPDYKVLDLTGCS